MNRNLLYKYAWLKSRKKQECLNHEGKPIPWFSYPAIDFLSQFDFSDKDVFEYGCGNSTLFWSERAKSVVAVESFKDWYEKIKQKAGSNVELILSSNEVEEYAGQIDKFGQFDIIVIDGIGESRLRCAQLAKRKLRPGGMIILDNSDLWVKSAECLRTDSNLIQVDFTGFIALMSTATTTSLFLTRDIQLKPRLGVQPVKSIAQPAEVWNEPTL